MAPTHRCTTRDAVNVMTCGSNPVNPRGLPSRDGIVNQVVYHQENRATKGNMLSRHFAGKPNLPGKGGSPLVGHLLVTAETP